MRRRKRGTRNASPMKPQELGLQELTTVTWVSLTGTVDPDLELGRFQDSSENGIGSCNHGEAEPELDLKGSQMYMEEDTG
ncbi:hypothetical protein STEG23_010846 [Scotinomys teguina]